MRARLLDVNAVLVGDRYRKDLGDLTELMRSMANEGLRHPIVVLDNHELLAGERRLEAARRLGWRDIMVATACTVAEAVEALRADQETLNLPGCLQMKVSERVAQAEPLYAMHLRKTGGKSVRPKGVDRRQREAYEVEAIAAHAVDMGRTRYRSVRFILMASKGRRTSGRPVIDAERQLAQQALNQIDEGAGVELITNRLRAQFGYVRLSRAPVLPFDPRRVSVPDDKPDKLRAANRKPLLQQVDSAVVDLVRIANRLDRLAQDDRWTARQRDVAPATRTGLAHAIEQLIEINRQFQLPKPKGKP